MQSIFIERYSYFTCSKFIDMFTSTVKLYLVGVSLGESSNAQEAID